MFYSVYKGRKPGIYFSWLECQQQVTKFPGAKFKKFSCKDEAEQYLKDGIGIVLDKTKIVPSANYQDHSKNHHLDKLFIYTDGSCPNNGKIECRGGIGVHFQNSELLDISISYQVQPTNQKMELLAIDTALKKVLPSKDKYTEIHLYTDSQYSIDCVTKYIDTWIRKNWKTTKNELVKNKDIIQSIYNNKLKFSNLFIHHINSHTGKQDQHSLGNEQADKLAFKAANEEK